MTGFPLDTNVLSEFNRRGEPDERVKHWLETADTESLYTSVLTFGEIRFGIELLPPSKRRDQLERWLERDLHEWFDGRILPVDQSIADRWGLLRDQAQLKGAFCRSSTLCWRRPPSSTTSRLCHAMPPISRLSISRSLTRGSHEIRHRRSRVPMHDGELAALIVTIRRVRKTWSPMRVHYQAHPVISIYGQFPNLAVLGWSPLSERTNLRIDTSLRATKTGSHFLRRSSPGTLRRGSERLLPAR